MGHELGVLSEVLEDEVGPKNGISGEELIDALPEQSDELSAHLCYQFPIIGVVGGVMEPSVLDEMIRFILDEAVNERLHVLLRKQAYLNETLLVQYLLCLLIAQDWVLHNPWGVLSVSASRLPRWGFAKKGDASRGCAYLQSVERLTMLWRVALIVLPADDVLCSKVELQQGIAAR